MTNENLSNQLEFDWYEPIKNGKLLINIKFV